MHPHITFTDRLLQTALQARARGEGELCAALEAIAAPIYMTDAAGLITFFNSHCVGFAGRTPALGKDRWCVTWRLFTEAGDYLPHDQCPMALAIKNKSSVRGVTAVAERPDGTRVLFVPLPTPLLGDDGELVGAVNLLLDVTDIRQIEDLYAQVARCRRLAADTSDDQTQETLTTMAREYEAMARELEAQLVALAASS